MNVIERILARHAGLESVKAGDDITVAIDLAIAHDVTGPMAIEQFLKIGVDRVFDATKVVFVIDHNIPCSTINARKQQNVIRDFAANFGVRIYDKADGVIHQVIMEEGLYQPGDIIVGADSHTCTAGAFGVIGIPVGSTEVAAAMALGEIELDVPEMDFIEVTGHLQPGVTGKDIILYLIGHFGTNGFTDRAVVVGGDAVVSLDSDSKMTIANMMIEMGAMIGYIDQGDQEIGEAANVYHFDATAIPPVAACPSSPDNVKPIAEIEGTKIDQAAIGSCTNGRYSDMAAAAKILRGKKVAPGVNLVVFPASKRILEKMEAEGLTKLFRDAGAIVTNPGCGPCFGAHQGLLADEDIAISTTNRNFPGRMGSPKAQVYLASPQTVAASALAGKIVLPPAATEVNR